MFVRPARPTVFPYTTLFRSWARFREQVEAHGKSIPMMCCSPDFTHPDKDFRKQEIEKEKYWIDMTYELGGSYCRVLSGQKRRRLCIGVDVDFAAMCIEECLPYAQSEGDTLIPANHYQVDFCEYPEFGQKMVIFSRLVHKLDDPSFGVNYDPCNPYSTGEEPRE